MTLKKRKTQKSTKNWVKSATTRQHEKKQGTLRRARFFLPGGPEGFPEEAHALNNKRRVEESEDVLEGVA